jgi:hypothetical protein
MKYHEFFISESSDLRSNELFKSGYDDRTAKFLDYIRQGIPFELVGGGTVVIDPSTYNDVMNQVKVAKETKAQGKNFPKIVLKTKSGQEITSQSLLKTADFGGKAGNPNRGEMAEGVFGAATFARMVKRPTEPISIADVKSIVNELGLNNGTINRGNLPDLANSNIVDDVRLVVKLKPATWNGFIDPAIFDSYMGNIVKGIVQYVNDKGVGQYAKYFEANGKPDIVTITSDGISDEVGSKTDIYMEYTSRDEPGSKLVHFDLSVKVGTTKQFGQRGAGAVNLSLDERFEYQKELWRIFDIDIEPVRENFIRSKNIISAISKSYEYVSKVMNQLLEQDSNSSERKFLKQLLHGADGNGGINYFGTLNQKNVKLVQFHDSTAGGYYLLDFKKLDEKLSNIDLATDVLYQKGKLPKLIIYDATDVEKYPDSQIENFIGKQELLLSVRLMQVKSGYLRNYIEKEKLLTQLTTVREKKNPRTRKTKKK